MIVWLITRVVSLISRRAQLLKKAWRKPGVCKLPGANLQNCKRLLNPMNESPFGSHISVYYHSEKVISIKLGNYWTAVRIHANIYPIKLFGIKR